jgi:hypothetical protein
MCFGSITVFIAMAMVGWQEYFSTIESQALLRISPCHNVNQSPGMVIVIGISAGQMKVMGAEMDKL